MYQKPKWSEIWIQYDKSIEISYVSAYNFKFEQALR